ncbi:DUF454 family protein [bacterium]|nr:DUF454 family protein [bacterium]
MARWGLYLLGSLSLLCGLVGLLLPLVPTTPFLLLSSYCFVRSDPLTHRWLLSHPWFGSYLRDWEVHRGVRRHVKILAVTMVVGVVCSLWLTDTASLLLRTIGTVLATCGLLVIWRLPVVSTQPSPKLASTSRQDAKSPDLDLDWVA